MDKSKKSIFIDSTLYHVTVSLVNKLLWELVGKVWLAVIANYAGKTVGNWDYNVISPEFDTSITGRGLYHSRGSQSATTNSQKGLLG